MAYFRCGTGGGIPAQLVTDMNAVLNKKFGTSSQSYPYTDWAKDINLMGLLPEKIASGAIASFTDGADDVPVKEAVFDITAVQAGSGDPTPSNVRAISGYTGMNVTKAGKNLLDINSVVQGGLDENTGAETTSSTVKRSGWIKVKANTTYILSNITNVRPYYYKAVQTSGFISRDSVTSSTFTTPASCVWLRLQAANSSWSGTNIQLEEGSTATTYEAYKGTVIPVSWQTEAGTVYGGSLNVTTGVLTVTHGIVDLGSLSWSPIQTFFRSSAISDMKSLAYDSDLSSFLCSALKTKPQSGTWANMNDGEYGCYQDKVQVCLTNYSTGEAVKTALSGVQFVYELATPVTYQLTPHQMNTLMGNNNIWADTGDASVIYRADISGGIREYLFKMDGTVSSFWANSWAERQRYLYNIGKWAFNQSKDIYIDVEFNGLPSSELNIVNFYVSDNRVFKVRTSSSTAQCKVQFGGGDAISWTAFDQTKTLSFRILRNYKIQIYSGDSLVASYDAPDSGSYRSIWNNTDGNIFCYGSTLAEYNIKSINMYAK